MSNKGPKDKYTSLMVADRLRVLSDEMDIMDDGYSDVLQAAMSFDDNQLLEALNKLKQSPTSKISTLATELLAHWQPENAVTVEDEAEDILNMDPLPLTRRPDDPAHDDLMQRMNAVTAESVEDEDILDMIEPVFAELTQQKNEIAAKKAAEPQIKSALKGNKTSSLGRNLVIGNMLVDPEKNIIVDPANEKTMNGNGGVSGAIKAMFAEKGLLRSYVTDLLKFPKVAGKRCPNGEVKHTVTGGIDVIHTSAPDLREKQNRQPGSKREPSDEAKEKLFQAYYNAFRMAHNLNSNDKAPKPISVPLLGAGIFKWPAELSAEIAGKAMTAFRDKYGNGLKINLYARPEDLKNGLTEEKLNNAINQGAVFLRTVTEMKQFIGMINTYQDNANILKPLAAKLSEIIDSDLPDNSKLWQSSNLIQHTLDSAQRRAAIGNITMALDAIIGSRDGNIKVNEQDFTPEVKKEDSGRPQHEYRKQKVKKELKLPSMEVLKQSPLRTVYVTLTYTEDPKVDMETRAFNKISRKKFLHELEAASKDSPDLLPTTTDPESAVEWAEQLQDDLIRIQTNEKSIVVSVQVPEILFQTKGTNKNKEQEQGNYLDTNLIQMLVSTEEGKSLLKINQVAIYDEFDVTKEQAKAPQTPPTTSTPTISTTSQPVKIDGVKQAKLNFINGFMDKFNALPGSDNSKMVKEQMLRDLNNYAQSTDKDIQSHAMQVLSQLNQQKATIQASEPQAVLNRDLKLDKELSQDYLPIETLSRDLIDNMVSSKAFDEQPDSVRGSLLEMVKFLRVLNNEVEDFLKGNAKLGKLIDLVKSNGIPNAESTNPLQILKAGIDQLASALKVTDLAMINDLRDLQEQINNLSKKQNIPLDSSSIDLQKALTKTPELSIKETSKSTQSLKINIKDMYDNERSLSIDRNTTLSAFARNAVKRITHSKDPERDSQIAGIQALVDNVNNANDPEKKDAATRELVFALQYVKYEIARTKKTSLISALDTVCDKIMATIPNKDSYQVDINLGKVALDKVKPKEVPLESKSTDKPHH